MSSVQYTKTSIIFQCFAHQDQHAGFFPLSYFHSPARFSPALFTRLTPFQPSAISSGRPSLTVPRLSITFLSYSPILPLLGTSPRSPQMTKLGSTDIYYPFPQLEGELPGRGTGSVLFYVCGKHRGLASATCSSGSGDAFGFHQ